MNMVQKAHEEMKDLMTEHITNSDRMNALFNALASDTKYNINRNQRKEIVKLFGVAAEIFEESLSTFVSKVVTLLQKLLKESQEYLHLSISWSMGRVISCITAKIDSLEEGAAQTDQVLMQLYSDFSFPNQALQVGTALCIDQVLQNTKLQVMTYLAPVIATKVTEILKSRNCKAHAQLMACLSSMIISMSQFEGVNQTYFQNMDSDSHTQHSQLADIIMPVLIVNIQNDDWAARRSALQAISFLIQSVNDKSQLAVFKHALLPAVNERKSDKFKPVREMAAEAIVAVRMIPDYDRSQNLATFSPNRIGANMNEVNEFAQQIIQESENTDRSGVDKSKVISIELGQTGHSASYSNFSQLPPKIQNHNQKYKRSTPQATTTTPTIKNDNQVLNAKSGTRRGWETKKTPRNQAITQLNINSIQQQKERGNLSSRVSRDRDLSAHSGTGTKISMATQKKLQQRNNNNKLQFNQNSTVTRTQPKQGGLQSNLARNRSSIFTGPKNQNFFVNQELQQESVEVYHQAHSHSPEKQEKQYSPNPINRSSSPMESPNQSTPTPNYHRKLISTQNIQTSVIPDSVESLNMWNRQQTTHEDELTLEEVEEAQSSKQKNMNKHLDNITKMKSNLIDQLLVTAAAPSSSTNDHNVKANQLFINTITTNQDEDMANSHKGQLILDEDQRSERGASNDGSADELDQYISKYGQKYAKHLEKQKSERDNSLLKQRSTRQSRSRSKSGDRSKSERKFENELQQLNTNHLQDTIQESEIRMKSAKKSENSDNENMDKSEQVILHSLSNFPRQEQMHFIGAEYSEDRNERDTSQQYQIGGQYSLDWSKTQNDVQHFKKQSTHVESAKQYFVQDQSFTNQIADNQNLTINSRQNAKSQINFDHQYTEGNLKNQRNKYSIAKCRMANERIHTQQSVGKQIVDDFSNNQSDNTMFMDGGATSNIESGFQSGPSIASKYQVRMGNQRLQTSLYQNSNVNTAKQSRQDLKTGRFAEQNHSEKIGKFKVSTFPSSREKTEGVYAILDKVENLNSKEVIQIDKSQFLMLMDDLTTLSDTNCQLTHRIQALESTSNLQVQTLTQRIDLLQNQVQELVIQNRHLSQYQPSETYQQTDDNVMTFSPAGAGARQNSIMKTQNENLEFAGLNPADNYQSINQRMGILPFVNGHQQPLGQGIPQTFQSQSIDINDLVRSCIQDSNFIPIENLEDEQLQTLSPQNIDELLSVVHQKLLLQKGRHELNKGTFRIDSDLIDQLLKIIILVIRNSFSKVNQKSQTFLDLIQLMIDLLQDESVLNEEQKKEVELIYEEITNNVEN